MILPCHSITPVINIVQTFMNEEALYQAIVNLPLTGNFLEAITSKFKFYSIQIYIKY